jgi:hypothetical protein
MEFVHAGFLFCDLRRIESTFTAKGAVNRDRACLFWVPAPYPWGYIDFNNLKKNAPDKAGAC